MQFVTYVRRKKGQDFNMRNYFLIAVLFFFFPLALHGQEKYGEGCLFYIEYLWRIMRFEKHLSTKEQFPAMPNLLS